MSRADYLKARQQRHDARMQARYAETMRQSHLPGHIHARFVGLGYQAAARDAQPGRWFWIKFAKDALTIAKAIRP